MLSLGICRREGRLPPEEEGSWMRREQGPAPPFLLDPALAHHGEGGLFRPSPQQLSSAEIPGAGLRLGGLPAGGTGGGQVSSQLRPGQVSSQLRPVR